MTTALLDTCVLVLLRQLRTAFPDALATEWQPLVPTIQLPNPDDRHVVAAALAGQLLDTLTDLPGDG